jgi:hypothetical protein
MPVRLAGMLGRRLLSVDAGQRALRLRRGALAASAGGGMKKAGRVHRCRSLHLARGRNRIVELKERAADRAEVTTAKLIAMCLETYNKALEWKQGAAAVAAIKEAGILSGKRVERQEIGSAGEFDKLTMAELEKMLAEEYERIRAIPTLELEAEECIRQTGGLMR